MLPLHHPAKRNLFFVWVSPGVPACGTGREPWLPASQTGVITTIRKTPCRAVKEVRTLISGMARRYTAIVLLLLKQGTEFTDCLPPGRRRDRESSFQYLFYVLHSTLSKNLRLLPLVETSAAGYAAECLYVTVTSSVHLRLPVFVFVLHESRFDAFQS
jgi:hypothetical protein